MSSILSIWFLAWLLLDDVVATKQGVVEKLISFAKDFGWRGVSSFTYPFWEQDEIRVEDRSFEIRELQQLETALILFSF